VLCKYFRKRVCYVKFLFLFLFLFLFFSSNVGHQASDWTLQVFVTQKCFSSSDWHMRALFFCYHNSLASLPSPSLFYEPHQLYFPFISESYSTTGHFVAQQITPKPLLIEYPQAVAPSPPVIAAPWLFISHGCRTKCLVRLYVMNVAFMYTDWVTAVLVKKCNSFSLFLIHISGVLQINWKTDAEFFSMYWNCILWNVSFQFHWGNNSGNTEVCQLLIYRLLGFKLSLKLVQFST
jgi:hypothetical protein